MGKALKVPLHQIRLTLKWYGWVGLDEDMDRGFLNVVYVF